MHPSDWFAIFAIFFAASATAITGIGFALMCAPLLTLALGGVDGVRVVNTLGVVLSCLMVGREFRNTNVTQAALLFAPAAVAIPLTAWVIKDLDPSALSILSGVVVLVAVFVLAKGIRVRKLSGVLGASLAGVISGAMTVSGGVGGPAVATYAINADWPAQTLRPTLGAYFLGTGLLAVASRGVPHLSGGLWVGLFISLAAGFAAGAATTRRLDHALVRNAIFVLAVGGAMTAIAQAIL